MLLLPHRRALRVTYQHRSIGSEQPTAAAASVGDFTLYAHDPLLLSCLAHVFLCELRWWPEFMMRDK